MIPRLQSPEHKPAWQQQLSEAVRSRSELLRLLDINPGLSGQLPVDQGFPLRVPHAFVARMQRGNIDDPLLRQVLPVSAEADLVDGFGRDPLGEQEAMPVPGLLHKYPGRALLTVTGACAVHCRYCFRRHFPYDEANPAGTHWPAAISYLQAHREIGELILSGGDPLSLSNRRLQDLTERLRVAGHLHTLRIHTRLPVVLPARIDQGLLDWLARLPLRTVVVVHCNHPNEIDPAVCSALGELAETGTTLLNQSVLLRGVNDDVAILEALSRKLFAAGVLPYYLHQLDRVQGAAHFALPDRQAMQLAEQLRSRLPGYLLPRLVRECPGSDSKIPLAE